MDILHVQIVRRDRVGDRVRRHQLRLLDREARHLLRVNLQRVVAELRAADSLEAVRPRREVRIALDPMNAVDVHDAGGDVIRAIFVL